MLELVNKSGQDVQDEIFRNMTVEAKLEVWVGLWRLAKDLAGHKFLYGRNRSKKSS